MERMISCNQLVSKCRVHRTANKRARCSLVRTNSANTEHRLSQNNEQCEQRTGRTGRTANSSNRANSSHCANNANGEQFVFLTRQFFIISTRDPWTITPETRYCKSIKIFNSCAYLNFITMFLARSDDYRVIL